MTGLSITDWRTDNYISLRLSSDTDEDEAVSSPAQIITVDIVLTLPRGHSFNGRCSRNFDGRFDYNCDERCIHNLT